jgi:hypothetical protein
MEDRNSALGKALHSAGPASDRSAQLALYGFLVGAWDADAVLYPKGDDKRRARGEIHAGWVLGGRAIQDIWILPGVFHGTTLRVYDPRIDAWQIRWIDPITQSYPAMIGRSRGADIVQEGRADDGAPIRWSFTNITPDAFRWSGEICEPGEAWRLQLEFFASRRRTP